MPAYPLVSLVTSFYNRAETVADSLGSLLAQDYPNYEIIAIDDGSSDETLAEMRKFDDSRLHLITRENKGFTRSICEAVRLAKGEFIAMHDGGDVSHPDRIRKQVEILTTMPNVGVCSCQVVNPIIGTGRTKLLGKRNGLNFEEALLKENLFTHGEVMFRRRVYDEVGGYRTVFYFSQDLDLWLRMSKHVDYHIIQEPLYSRPEIDGSVSATPDKTLRQQRFSELARQCAERRSAGLTDLVDQYCDGALDHMLPSKRLADKLAMIALRYAVRADDIEGARKLASAARAEAPTIKNRAVNLAVQGYSIFSPLRNGISSAIRRH